MNQKNFNIIVGIIAGVILLGFLYFILMFFAAFGGGGLLYSNPPKPEITYGEFPISITYELNGETKVVEDTIICEFDGFETLGEAGKYRKWKAHLKSGNKRMILLRVDTTESAFEISTSYGSPNYYMGDLRQSREEYEKVLADDRYLGYIQWENGVQTGRSILKEEVWEKYRLKIINIQYSPPIENSFK